MAKEREEKKVEEMEIELIGKSEYLLRLEDSEAPKGYSLVHWKGIGHRLTLQVSPENRESVKKALDTGWLRRIR